MLVEPIIFEEVRIMQSAGKINAAAHFQERLQVLLLAYFNLSTV